MENNRLRFRHCDKIFDTRAEAIHYIEEEIKVNPVSGSTAKYDTSLKYSLYAEPTVLRYKNVTPQDETGEKNPHLIFVIGSKTNDEGVDGKNRFCIIDIDKTEDEIANINEALNSAIRSLTLVTVDSDSLHFTANETESGTTLSGEVKVPSQHDFVMSDESVLRWKNNLMVGEGEGLFIHVDLKYDAEHESFTFRVNNASGGVETTTVQLPNNYVVSGEYSVQNKCIYLTLKNGQTVTIDCSNFINACAVDAGTNTPIILSGNPWNDVLYADVRLKDEGDSSSTNLLKRTVDGRALFVDSADVAKQFKVRGDEKNMVVKMQDGIFASAEIVYTTSADTQSGKKQYIGLKLSKTNPNTGALEYETKYVEIPIAQFINGIRYDAATECLIISYTDGAGEVKQVSIPVESIIVEWNVANDGHNVHLVKTPHSISGTDMLSADVKISNGSNNILQNVDNHLYVNGVASNIKYETTGDTTVKNAIDVLTSSSMTLNTKIENEISRSTNAEETLSAQVDAVSAETLNRVKQIYSNGNTLLIGGTKETPDLAINFSTQFSGDTSNIITMAGDGVYATVNLDYFFNEQTGHNELVFTNTNQTKRFDLKTTSSINRIYYDSSKEAIIIVYTVNGQEREVVVPVGDLIDEWRVEDGHPHAIQLEKVRAASGSTAQDVLKASVVITSGHSDNILVMDDGALYVSNSGITANATAIANEQNRATNAEQSLSTTITNETSRATTAEQGLTTAIANETARAISAETALGDRITDNILEFGDTNSIEFTKSVGTTSSTITASAKLESNGGNNIIKIGNGLYANVNLTYDSGRNELTFEKTCPSGTTTSIIPLNAGSIIDSMYYDDATQELVIVYEDSQGVQHTVRVDVSDLFNEWVCDSNHIGGILLNKSIGTGVGGADVLSASVVVSSSSNNILVNDNGVLIVDGSQISANTTAIANETARATAKETVLEAAISANTQGINTLNNSISGIANSELVLNTSDGTTTTLVGRYSPTYGNTQTFTINIPKSVTKLDEWNGTTRILTIPGGLDVTNNVTVSGTITSQGAIYSSDINLKENIETANFSKKVAANKVDVKEFNFKDDVNKAKVYGIIAQELEEKGLGDIVYTKEDGYKAVDYTSLMMLKISYLENENRVLSNALIELRERIKTLEDKETQNDEEVLVNEETQENTNEPIVNEENETVTNEEENPS